MIAVIFRLFGYMIVASFVIAAVLLVAAYALLVAIVGAIWSVKEALARRRGRPYVDPGERFQQVWNTGISPCDPKSWVTPEVQPATDPHLLPGQVTGSLRIESLGIERIDEEGPFEWFAVKARIHNHGNQSVTLGDIDHTDLQLWTPTGKVAGTHTTWPAVELKPGYTYTAQINTRLVDEQPIQSWALAHRPDGEYVFFQTKQQNCQAG